MKIIVETNRLILREIVPSDLEALFELDSDPEVHKYLGNKPVKTIKESQKYIDSLQQQYIERGIGRWAVVLKETQEFIGWSGLRLNTEFPMNGFTNYYDVGYHLKKCFWGKGYATESGLAAIQYAFDTMKLKTIYGITEMGNKASHNTLLKIGLDYVKNFYCDREDLNLRWYKISNTSRM